jgi:hypothetical protein
MAVGYLRIASIAAVSQRPALDPSPVIPSDLSFGYLSAELKSPVKIPIPDCPIDQIMEVIEEHINHFFVQALQLDPFTLRQEAMNNEV